MTDATIKPVTKRRYMFLAAVWSLAIGAVLALVGLLAWWTPLIYLGSIVLVVGAIWLVCVPFVDDEPLSTAHRRYMRTFFPAMGGYVLAVVVLGSLKHQSLPTWAMTLVALLPVLPMIWVVVIMWRFTRESDELEQRVQLESVFVTCGVVGLLAFALGMLQSVGVMRFEGGLILALPAMFLVYAVAGWWFRRKHGLKGLS